MKRFLYNPPLIVKKIFNKTKWDTSNNKILLTFDDGPIPETTNIILDILEENKIIAAFFCVGQNIEKYPLLAKKIIDRGHLIGNHTFTHKTPSKLSKENLIKEIEEFNKVANNELKYTTNYFRPPHGKFDMKTLSVLKQYKLQNVMWSLLTFDYKNDINIVKFSVKNYLRSDSIIVLHDSRKSKEIIKQSIDFIIETSQKFEFKIGAPAECLR